MGKPRGGIAELMKAQGIERHELMARFGVTERTVRRWEEGSSGMTLGNLNGLADFFGVSTDQVLGRKSAGGCDRKKRSPRAVAAAGGLDERG